ncbi:MAG: TRAP transporter substrate-binding protein DctP [Deltaproteobacteria bacterium]|nr:TRAP transporter substrate-binding protein DctP [Deltaproteobacteria bacterium]
MKRREFLGKVGGGAAVAAAAATALSPVSAQAKAKTFKWKLCASWPPKFPALMEGTERLAKNITEMSNGQLQIQTFAAGELIGGLEVFDAVSQGKVVQAGSTALYYYYGKFPEGLLFSEVPFAMLDAEKTAWFYCGGGLELMQKALEPHNMTGFPMISTGTQMGGWFRKEINTIDDLKGLKMRIPGLPGKVMAKAGVNVVNVLGSEIFTNLERGVIDAAEWVNPLLDLRLGFHQAAKYYYYPGWHEPATFAQLLINLKAWNELPAHLKALVTVASAESTSWVKARSDSACGAALKELVEKHGVILKRFPDEVLKKLYKLTKEVMAEEMAKHPGMKPIYEAMMKFKAEVDPWMDVSERAYVWPKD